ncbi:CobW family GTP-binding protein [Parvibaculum sp. MBR-TMA-1.3b-4.2]
MRIPITLLTGYLGAGKTTIINALLSQNPDRRMAVLVNDFGAVNIDASLIASRDGDTVRLANGCVCCSIKDDLGTALDELAKSPHPPEHVLLEASGVADPQRIARHAGHWPGFELDAIVTAVDCETVRERAADKFVGHLVESQILTADIIALTKSDLVAPRDADSTTRWLHSLNGDALVTDAPHGRVELALLLGPRPGRPSPPAMPDQPHDAFRTMHWVPKHPVDTEKLSRVLSEMPRAVHRIKGFFVDARSGRMTLLQQVGRRFRFSDAPKTAAPGLVLIASGPDMDLARYRRDIESCQSTIPSERV